MVRFITHAGTYHADDVLATALLEIVMKVTAVYADQFKPFDENDCRNNLELPLLRVAKIEDVKVTPLDIVYDIGGGKFDHHQKDKRIRENGIPYAAFGLLWDYYADNRLGLDSEIAKMMDEDFIQYIDQTDNYGQAKYPNTLSALISANFQAGVDFLDCVHMVKPMLENLIASYDKLSDQRTEVLLIIRDTPKGNLKRIFLGGDNHYDGRVFRGTEVKFVTGPSNRGPGVVLRSLDSEHYPIVDVKGISPLFIHTGRFTATYQNEEEALAAARESIKIGEEKEGE